MARSDERDAGRHAKDGVWWWVAVLAAVVVAAKLPTLTVPFHWDELGWAGQARWLSEGPLVRAFPGFRDAGAFQGRPPALFLAAALLWRLTGPVAAHLLVAALAAAGVCFTYLLGRRLYDGPTGFLAALLLLVTPIWFAQAGMFLGDLPVAALGVASVYLALTGRLRAYLLTASVMVLVKETSVAVVAALLVYLAIVTPGRRAKLATVLRHAAPLVVLGCFFGWQKIATGHFLFTIMSQDLGVVSQLRIPARAARVTDTLFVEQNRFLLTGLIALHLLFAKRRGKEWLLYLLVVAFAGYAYSFLWTLPRYFLPVVPFLCLAGARSVMDLARTPARGAAAGAVLLAALSAPLLERRIQGNGETDMTYLRMVEAHRETVGDIAAHFPDRRIITAFPHLAEFRDPAMGYVERPVDAVPPAAAGEPGPTDLLLLPVAPVTIDVRPLHVFARSRGWRRIARWEHQGVVSELYGPPARAAAPAPP